jgi:bis(5'-nucleosidyl)-tetraphosphatase
MQEDMLIQASGIIIFRTTPQHRLFLLLHHHPSAKVPEGHWYFAKGRAEAGESAEETAIREVYEETGIRGLSLISGFREMMQYANADGREKVSTFFLAEAPHDSVQLSDEHQGFAWLRYEEAYEKLTYQDAKEVLKKANDFLLSHS